MTYLFKRKVSLQVLYRGFLLLVLYSFSPCQGENQRLPSDRREAFAHETLGDTVNDIGMKIDFIFQDKKGNYWFASNGEGIFRYDGKIWLRLTTAHGLCSDFVWSIQEDRRGNLWFGTRDGYCVYDGKSITDYTLAITHAPYAMCDISKAGILFGHRDGICYYNGDSFSNFIIHPASYAPDPSSTYRPYGMYCALRDRSGNLWIGTQEKGVCLYDGRSYSYLTVHDLAGPAVRAIYQDTKGILWFGNNGGGLFRYDGKSLRNITEENHLENFEFLRGRQPADKESSMARVFAINEDNQGHIWVGTADAGVWEYDGSKLNHYTIKDGLPGNSVPFIFKSRNGELWFVCQGKAIVRFTGKKFSKVNFN